METESKKRKMRIKEEIVKRIENDNDVLFIDFDSESEQSYSVINGDVSNIALAIYSTIINGKEKKTQIADSLLRMVKDIVTNLMANDDDYYEQFKKLVRNVDADDDNDQTNDGYGHIGRSYLLHHKRHTPGIQYHGHRVVSGLQKTQMLSPGQRHTAYDQCRQQQEYYIEQQYRQKDYLSRILCQPYTKPFSKPLDHRHSPRSSPKISLQQ